MQVCRGKQGHVTKLLHSARIKTAAFLRAAAGTAIARLSHRNSVRPSASPPLTTAGV